MRKLSVFGAALLLSVNIFAQVGTDTGVDIWNLPELMIEQGAYTITLENISGTIALDALIVK